MDCRQEILSSQNLLRNRNELVSDVSPSGRLEPGAQAPPAFEATLPPLAEGCQEGGANCDEVSTVNTSRMNSPESGMGFPGAAKTCELPRYQRCGTQMVTVLRTAPLSHRNEIFTIPSWRVGRSAHRPCCRAVPLVPIQP
jgi:hypothetical protein